MKEFNLKKYKEKRQKQINRWTKKNGIKVGDMVKFRNGDNVIVRRKVQYIIQNTYGDLNYKDCIQYLTTGYTSGYQFSFTISDVII